MAEPPTTHPADLLRAAEKRRSLILERITDTEATPRPIEEARPDLDEIIRAAASRIELSLGGVAQAPGEWLNTLYHLTPPKAPLVVRPAGRQPGHDTGPMLVEAINEISPPEPFPLLCAVAPALVKAWLSDALERAYRHLPAGSPTTAKAASLRDLRAELDKVEHEIADRYWGAIEAEVSVPVPSIPVIILIGLA